MLAYFDIDQVVIAEFERTMTRGWFCRLIRRLKRQSNQLVSYEDLIQHNTRIGQRELGTQIVCIDQIIGSLGRCEDFDRAFYPCQTFTRTRWLSIAKAKYQEVTLPLVELYKIGDTYFVKKSIIRYRLPDVMVKTTLMHKC